MFYRWDFYHSFKFLLVASTAKKVCVSVSIVKAFIAKRGKQELIICHNEVNKSPNRRIQRLKSRWKGKRSLCLFKFSLQWMSEGWNEWGKSAIFNEILNDCVRRVNKELLEEKSTAWSQQLINIPVWDELFSDTGNAIDVNVSFPNDTRVNQTAPCLWNILCLLAAVASFSLFSRCN